MRIGQLSQRTGVSVRAIRHYDAFGLLGPVREANRYRSFMDSDVDRVQLIQLLLGVGFSLAEIRAHAPCWRNGTSSVLDPVPDAELRAFLTRKLAQLDQHIEALATVRSRLQERLDAHVSSEHSSVEHANHDITNAPVLKGAEG
ncbi:MerR family transcriptional regulator [Silvibacterium sp.]|uniref:MerR family transcriptional regulator n=1 Tax=Silvibacterium sp. TaxID=1964179 RepID=UPI0039E6E19C